MQRKQREQRMQRMQKRKKFLGLKKGIEIKVRKDAKKAKNAKIA